MTAIVHHRAGAQATPFTRELDTPYSDHDLALSVATPSCCSCCCCCCLTALTIVPVFVGIDTNDAAADNGRPGVLWGIIAGFVLPVTTGAASILGVQWPNVAVGILWFVLATGLIALARSYTGATMPRAIGYGALASLVWVAAFIANFILDLALLFATVGIGILVELILVPLWIFLIVRRSRRRRAMRQVTPQYGGPAWPPYPGATGGFANPSFELPPPGSSFPGQGSPQDPYGP